jgi:hypothetical protein
MTASIHKIFSEEDQQSKIQGMTDCYMFRGELFTIIFIFSCANICRVRSQERNDVICDLNLSCHIA